MDVSGFEEEMERQREQSKSARQEIDLVSESADLMERISALPRTQFLGFDPRF